MRLQNGFRTARSEFTGIALVLRLQRRPDVGLSAARSKYTLKAGLVECSEIGYSGYDVTAGGGTRHRAVDNFDWRLVDRSVVVSEAVYFVVIFEIKIFLYP